MSTQNLWAPWRMQYIQHLADEVADAVDEVPAGCFLCEAADTPIDSELARERLLLVNDERGILLLNRFPYTSGHLLVACRDHVGDLADLTPDQRAGLMELVVLAEQVVRLAYNPQGLNVGMNLGRCAGAGVPGHLHIHIVPRWNGDTNFMSTIGSVRIVPQAIEQSYQQLRDALQQCTK